MNIRFSIHYKTTPGQNICVSGSHDLLGNWDPAKAFNLNYAFEGEWSATAEFPEDLESIHYNYILKDDHGNVIREWGNPRKVILNEYHTPLIMLNESWRSPSNEEKVMYSSAFHKVIMKPGPQPKPKVSRAKKVLQFKIEVPRIGRNYRVCVLGNQATLGNWNKKEPLLLTSGDNFPEWSASVNMQGLTLPIEYKYGIYDITKKEVKTIEEGENRRIDYLPEIESAPAWVSTDESFRYPLGNWKGAGVSVPVFSLRSDRGFGVGDFTDLVDFIDWAKQAGMKMVQILPVNETIASHNWLDSYPYKSISVMALHPIYMDIDKLGAPEDKKLEKEFAASRKKLNAETHVDYPEVLHMKSRYFKLMYDRQKVAFFETGEYKSFFEANKEWLVPYAAFVYLRDKMKSPDFRVWKQHNTYDPKAIEKMSSPGSEK